MAEEQQVVEENLTGLDKLQEAYEKNATVINGVVIAVLLIIFAFVFYLKVMKPKKEKAAQAAIFQAQYYFEQDSFKLALNGDNSSAGFVEIVEEFGSTKAGNLAKYSAGLSYFYLGDYASAEYYLNKFCPCGDDVTGGLGISALADAQMELGNTDAALKNYKKSAELSDNKAVAPLLLWKAGMAYELNGKYSQALDFYMEIKQNFPNSSQATDIEKYIGRVEARM